MVAVRGARLGPPPPELLPMPRATALPSLLLRVWQVGPPKSVVLVGSNLACRLQQRLATIRVEHSQLCSLHLVSNSCTFDGLDNAKSTCSVGSSKMLNKHPTLAAVVHCSVVEKVSHLEAFGYRGPSQLACVTLFKISFHGPLMYLNVEFG